MPGLSPYELKIDLNVLNHLGLNLYSNVPAVLSELIANAWDADATRVIVSVENGKNNKIVIKDDGHGMNDKDLREKFLTVGYERRKKGEEDKTKKKRPVMGRKGIGKLSVFSIAKNVQVITKKSRKTIAIEMDVEGIKKAIKRKEVYHPIIIKNQSNKTNLRSGTMLILKNLKKRVASSLDRHLRQRIAYRFSVFSKDFQVIVNGTEITEKDRKYFNDLEYSLVYGDFDTSKFKHDKKSRKKRSNKLERSQSVCGWIGLVKESKALKSSSENLNRISLFSRGKVALENMMNLYQEGGLYTKYIVGELEADFLDVTKNDDIATSSRQDFIQDDKRFVALKKFVQGELKFLAQKRTELKGQKGLEEARKIPAIERWYESLRGDSKNSAKKLFGKINSIAVDEKNRKILLKHGILAFEHLYHKQKLNELECLDINNLSAVVETFSQLDDIEATWYYEITAGRLDVIKKFSDHIKGNALEKIIQKHIYNHLWLLDPSWDRATETPTMERTVRCAFKKIKETHKIKKGRIDIQYKKTSGKHIIIELKRGSVKTSTPSIMAQLDLYIDALEEELKRTNNDDQVSIEAICIVGKYLDDWNTPKRKQQSVKSLDAKNIRVVTYQQLIKDAESSYNQYLQKRQDKGRIREILDEIDKS